MGLLGLSELAHPQGYPSCRIKMLFMFPVAHVHVARLICFDAD